MYLYLALEIVEDKDLVVDVQLVVLDEAMSFSLFSCTLLLCSYSIWSSFLSFFFIVLLG